MPVGVSDAGVDAGKTKPSLKPVSKKVKFDPDTLAPELRGIYDSMLAEFTTKTQDAAKIKKESEERLAALQKQVEDLSGTIQYYERLLPAIYQQGGEGAGDGGAAGRPAGRIGVEAGAPVNDEANWNPFDPESARAAARAEIRAYHEMLSKEYDKLVKGIMELEAYNLQLMKIQLMPIAQKVGIDLPDLNKIIQAAPQYGYNLEQAYRAVYESPEVYKRGTTEYAALVKERDDLKTKIAEADAAKAAMPMLGGTTGPIPRTVAKGKQPKTYSEVAATISPVEIFGDVGGAGAGTAGGAGAGEAPQ